jgi:uncharacterized membrane protein
MKCVMGLASMAGATTNIMAILITFFFFHLAASSSRLHVRLNAAARRLVLKTPPAVHTAKSQRCLRYRSNLAKG